MFLLQTFYVIIGVFWISALIAELFLTSPEEYNLPPSIRIGYGLFLSFAYFAGAWLILSPQFSWYFGFALLGVTLLYKKLFLISHLKNLFFKYYKTFIWFCLGAITFFVPLILSNNYGPFTEGGGDISIYADIAKYAQDNHLSEVGSQTTNFSNIISNINEILWPTPATIRWKHLDKTLSNPPTTEYSIYRIINKRITNFFFYFPYAAYGFLSSDTNYGVYFGIQAFLYILILAGIWNFFISISKKTTLIALFFVIGSQGLISVFYNMYSMQGTCLAITALIIATLRSITWWSWAGIRTYGVAILIIWLCYIHYLSIILPLLVGISLLVLFNVIKINRFSKTNTLSLLKLVIGTVFFAICILAFWVGSDLSIRFLKKLLFNSLPGNFGSNSFLGGAGVTILSLQWFSFLFGFLSQQHFLPYATEYSWLNDILVIGNISGSILLIFGFYTILKLAKSAVDVKGNKNFYLSVYFLALGTIIVQAYLARSSLYTEAKGAQNSLIYLYILILLPYALIRISLKETIAFRKHLYFFTPLLFVFTATLFCARIVYTGKLSFSQDRSLILEASYFSQAKKIINKDPKAFVLFEPRKSSDLYISDQPFFKNKMMPTRHLVISKEYFDSQSNTFIKNYVFASDIITNNDIPHLWTLSSICKPKWGILSACTWKAEKLYTQLNPSLLLFADNYEKNIRKLPVSKNSSEESYFSYIRNGAAMLWLPQGSATNNIIVTVKPREENQYLPLLNQIQTRIKRGELGSDVKLTSDGVNIHLNYDVQNTSLSSLKLVAKYDGEYWVNVKILDHELT